MRWSAYGKTGTKNALPSHTQGGSQAIFSSRDDSFVRPRVPFSQPPRAGAVKAGVFAATGRLGLDSLEHGGTLAWNGIAFLAWLELAVSGDYGRRARATSWRSVTRRLQASPDCLFCPAEPRHPRAGFLAAVQAASTSMARA